VSDDITQLAARLRVGPRELTRAIGGPWTVARRIPEREMEHPGTLIVGRAGPAVALLVSDDVDPSIVVGRPVGEWPGPGTLEWSVDDVVAVLRSPPREAPSDVVDDFLAHLGEAVEEAFRAARPRLVLCRFCGCLVAPEHAFSEDCCHGCGSTVHDVVY
jgi:hypothetical protein